MAGWRVGRMKIRAVDPHTFLRVPPVRSRGEAALQKRVLVPARMLSDGAQLRTDRLPFSLRLTRAASHANFVTCRTFHRVSIPCCMNKAGAAMLLLFIHEIKSTGKRE